MKFICAQQNFLPAIIIAEKIIGRNMTLPVLQNILITSHKENGEIKLAATDLEIGVELTIPAKIEQEGSVAVPSRLFSGFLKSLPEEKIELSEKSSVVSLRCANYKSNIKGELGNDFPLIPEAKGEEEFIIQSLDLCDGIASVLYSCSLADIKPEISGVFLEVKKSGIWFVATDSFRLAEKRLSYTAKTMISRKAIIPHKTCDIILKIFEGLHCPLAVELDRNQIIIKNITEDSLMPKIRLVSRIIDGEYPQYEQIIPTSFLTEAEISREELVKHVKNASLFSNKINEITLRVDPQKQRMEVSSGDTASGDYESFIPCEIRGKERKLVFNFQYLTDGIQRMKGSDIRFKCNEEINPVLFMPSGADDFRYVVMPIKM